MKRTAVLFALSALLSVAMTSGAATREGGDGLV